MLLPCGKCCSTCQCPTGETLPSVVTATFSGLTKSAVKVSDLLSLSFKSCFGADAAGTVEATGGLPNDGGPITAISLTSGGSGYAVRGRTAPTALSITGDGTDATFTVSVVATTSDNCGRPLWEISSVKVTKGGAGYADNEQMSVSLGQDEFEEVPASISIRTKPSEPTLTATIATGGLGSGAELSVSTKIVSTEPDRWGADKVTVLQPGSGYYDGDTVWFDPQAGETTVTRGYGLVELKRIQPSVAVNYFGDGFGAILTPLLSQITDNQGRKAWECSSVTINAAGSGYVTGQFIYVYGDGLGQFADPPSTWSITAGVGGAIVSLTRVSAGRLFAYADEIESVKIENAGSYYGASDVVETVTVNDGGKYYKEDSNLAPIVADVTVEVSQSPPSDGAGAKITATVNKVVGGAGFGTISSIKLDNGGDDYLKWSYLITDCSVEYLNDKSFVVPRWTPTTKLGDLVSLEFLSCFGSGAAGSVTVEGGDPTEGFPITKVTLDSKGQGYAVRGRTEPTGLSIALPAYANVVAAQCEITLAAQKLDNCNRPYWPISTIKVVDGGNGYLDAALLTVSLGQNEFEHIAASLTSKTDVYEPELSASPLDPATSGSGAGLTVTVKQVSDRRWGADYVTVGSPGTGYNEGDIIRFDPINGGITDGITGTGVVEVVRLEPSVTVEYFGSGSGAVFSPTLTKTTSNGRDVWACTQLAITSPGSGYFNGQNVHVRDQRPFSDSSVWEISAGEDGAVVAVTNILPGQLWEDSDGIAAVAVINHGFYYATDGALQEVFISSGGGYYKESNALPPIVANVTAKVTQLSPSHGSGASVVATVEDDVASPDFGKLDTLTLVSGGDGYLGWSFSPSCAYEACTPAGILRIDYKGKDTPPTASIRPYNSIPQPGECQIEFVADEADKPFMCDEMLFSADEILGGTVTVEAGNKNDALSCGTFYDAPSITVVIEGSDRTYTETGHADTVNPLCRNCWSGNAPFRYALANKVAGSELSGTYELSFVGVEQTQVSTFKIFEYSSGGSCGSKKITAVVSQDSMTIQISGVTVYETFVADSTTPDTGFSCSEPATCCRPEPGGTKVNKRSGGCFYFFGLPCGCDPQALAPRQISCGFSGEEFWLNLPFFGPNVIPTSDSFELQGEAILAITSVTPGE